MVNREGLIVGAASYADGAGVHVDAITVIVAAAADIGAPHQAAGTGLGGIELGHKCVIVTALVARLISACRSGEAALSISHNIHSGGTCNYDVLPNALTDLCPHYLPAAPRCPDAAAGEPYAYLCDYLRDRAWRWLIPETGMPEDPEFAHALERLTGQQRPEQLSREAWIEQLAPTFGQLRLHVQMDHIGQTWATPLAWEAGTTHGRRGLVNVVFVDGHTERISPEELAARLEQAWHDPDQLEWLTRVYAWAEPPEPPESQ